MARRSSKGTRCLGRLFLALIVFPSGGKASPWRVFGEADGLVEPFVLSVTIGPQGSVWITHSAGRAAERFDGYGVFPIAPTDEPRFPLWESRSGQVWSLYLEGVMEYRREAWSRYPLEPVRQENAADGLRRFQPIPLLPAERDAVLLLFPNRLAKALPAQRRVLTLREVEETSLETFTEMSESRDGGIWIVGGAGLAKVPGPVRRVDPDTPWTEYRVPGAWRLLRQSRAFEDDEGGVSLVADAADGEARAILSLNKGQWQPPLPAPDGCRYAWRGLGGSWWAVARGLLHVRLEDRWDPAEIPGTSRPQVFDVAVESGGVFWLATSEGLVRFAPEIWRSPPGLEPSPSPPWAVHQDESGLLIFATEPGLVQWRDGRQILHAWPADFALSPAPFKTLWPLPDGRLVTFGWRGALLCDAVDGRFEELRHPEAREIVGGTGNPASRRLWVQTLDLAGQIRIELFDGKEFRSVADLSPAGSPELRLYALDRVLGGQIWMGSPEGVAAWNPKTARFEPVPGSPAGPVYAFTEMPGGKVWCGGEGMITEFDGRSWSMVKAGLGRIHALHPTRDGGLWVASRTGLHRYLEGSWIANGPTEGLPAAEVRDVFQSATGEVWALTDRGLFHYHRDADSDPPRSAVLPDEFGRGVPTTATLTLSFEGRDKWNSTPADRLLFAWRLDDGRWSPFTEARSVVLTNLLAGRHRFAVRAIDRNWNEENPPALLEFNAFVPWYAEPRLMAVAALGFLVAGGLTWLALNRHLRLVRSHAEVERIVEQRTRELEQANQELLHSQKMRALGTLAAGIAHDFNSLLSIIKGSAQIIEDNLDKPDKITVRLQRIKGMVEQGSGVIRALLGLARISEPDLGACPVKETVAEAARVMAEPLGPGIALTTDLDAALPHARAAPDLFRQILLNLIANAADAMNGTGTIRLRGRVVTELPAGLVLHPRPAAAYVRVTVEDAGHGIEPDILSRIFEPFFTTKAMSTRRGTGLGLSMVYELAKGMNLGLGVDSVSGRGTTFAVLLPAVD